MIKQLPALLLMCIVPNIVWGGVTGPVDKRVVIGWVGEKPDYVDKLLSTRNVWNTTHYNNYVCVGKDKMCGSGQFISPKHILTNKHVVIIELHLNSFMLHYRNHVSSNILSLKSKILRPDSVEYFDSIKNLEIIKIITAKMRLYPKMYLKTLSKTFIL